MNEDANLDATQEEILTEYTFTIVKMIPVVQTVVVLAEDAEDAFDMIEADDSAWTIKEDFDHNEVEFEVEDYFPRDVAEVEEDAEVDPNKPKRGRPAGSKNKPKLDA